jgi:hypothetical protein
MPGWRSKTLAKAVQMSNFKKFADENEVILIVCSVLFTIILTIVAMLWSVEIENKTKLEIAIIQAQTRCK